MSSPGTVLVRSSMGVAALCVAALACRASRSVIRAPASSRRLPPTSRPCSRAVVAVRFATASAAPRRHTSSSSTRRPRATRAIPERCSSPRRCVGELPRQQARPGRDVSGYGADAVRQPAAGRADPDHRRLDLFRRAQQLSARRSVTRAGGRRTRTRPPRRGCRLSPAVPAGALASSRRGGALSRRSWPTHRLR